MQTDLDLSRGKGKHQSQSEQFGAAGRAGLWHRVSATELWEKGLKPRFAWVRSGCKYHTQWMRRELTLIKNHACQEEQKKVFLEQVHAS
jgi:hypothetical protein